MAILMISAKPAFLPAPDDLCGWEPCSDTVFFRAAGEYKLYCTPCIADVGRKQRLKQDALSAFVQFVQEREPEEADFYLIAHDKDLLKAAGNAEGIYPQAGLEMTGSALASLLPPRHIYAFQHVARQDMFETLIARLLDDDLDPQVVLDSVNLINTCVYDTSLS